MVSKNDLLVGVLVLIAGILIYGFTPAAAAPGAGFLFMAGPAHPTSHYVGGTLAVVFGIVGLALYKKVNKLTLVVAALSLILGVVFILDAPGNPLYQVWAPHGQAMATTGGLTLLVGLAGIAGSAALKKK
jgi:hypothetical protein